jgi:bifunctional DNA-binding transcriptional regulator/antitoxin component of YhaV-PrlF toxin-antitoxin module
MKENTDNIEISKVWITGKSSCTIVIPKRFAKELGLNPSTHVIIERMSDGILVRRLGARE